PGERGDHERAGVDRGARMPPHLLAHVGEIAVHEAPAPDPRLVEMPGQHDGEERERGDDGGAERWAAIAGRREPVRGEHRRRPERERALAEEGDAEPDPRPPEAASSAREGARGGEKPGERAQRERRVEQERAPEADEARRECEDGAGCEPAGEERGGEEGEPHRSEPRCIPVRAAHGGQPLLRGAADYKCARRANVCPVVPPRSSAALLTRGSGYRWFRTRCRPVKT